VRSARETGAVTDLARDEPAVVVARGLRMAYGDEDVIRGIDLDVRRGETFVLVGPGGAGKTTTLEVLEGCRHRTGGEVSVLGSDPASAGPDWRARIGVALPLAGKPELVFLDEPTAGLDCVARRSVWSVLAAIREHGATIIVATDSMEEAAAVADRIAILAAGRIVAAGTPRTLAARTSSRISFALPPTVRLCDLPEPARVGARVDDARRVTLRSTVPMAVLGALAPWAEEHGCPLRDIEVRGPNLEDFYLEMTAGR
jgi:ABC-type multidrug transport system ATPase subunit